MCRRAIPDGSPASRRSRWSTRFGVLPSLGVSARRGVAAGQRKAATSALVGAPPAGHTSGETSSEADAEPECTQSHHAQCVVGYRHDHGLSGGCRVGLHRAGAGLVHAKERQV